MEKVIQKFRQWVGTPEFWIIILILAVASFLRFYKLSEYMTFLGDEGRDVLMMKRILVDHDFPLLGPPSSVGNVYLGPLYYYMMAIPMSVFWLNPEAAAGMVALIGTATVGLVYYLSRKWFGLWPAILAGLLYATSFVTINSSRSSWNPNPAPFFALLAILGIDFCLAKRNSTWLILTGAAAAAAIQMHYLALILLPILFILWLYQFRLAFKQQKKAKFILSSFLAVLAFLLIISPLIIFDIKYNFMNYHGLVELFTDQNSAVKTDLFTGLGRLLPIYQDKLIGRYLTGENGLLSLIISFLVIIPILLKIVKSKSTTAIKGWPIFILAVWLMVSLAFLTMYRQEIYDHYLGFVSPAPFLLLAAFVGLLKIWWQKVVTILLLLVLITLNIPKNPLNFPPNQQLKRTQEISRYVTRETQGQPFNFALLAERNYDSAYQFYFYKEGIMPKVLPAEKTDQLFVVCEDRSCDPINNPKYEIAAFGWARIASQEEFAGVRIYKLVPNPKGKPV